MSNASRPVIRRVTGGELSTVQIGNVIETVLFRDDGASVVIGRHVVRSVEDVATDHYLAYLATLD